MDYRLRSVLNITSQLKHAKTMNAHDPMTPPVTLPTWSVRGRDLVLDRVLLMGIVNVTPDSFADGGRYFDHTSALARARQLIDEGADILDIGGESTRPGADDVPPDEATSARLARGGSTG